MFSGLFLTTPVFANIIFDPLSPQDANTIPYIILSGGLANSITCIYPNGGDAYSQVANNNNPQYLYIGSYGFTNGVDYKFVEWDTQTLPQLGCADNYTLALLSPQYISTYSYIFQIPQQNQICSKAALNFHSEEQFVGSAGTGLRNYSAESEGITAQNQNKMLLKCVSLLNNDKCY